LVDELLAHGGFHIGVLDLAAPALERSQARLGPAAPEVEWIVADVTRYRAPIPWDVWHDRAVFHFLVEEDDREGYREALRSSVRPGGSAVVATFGPSGPERCSGLPVVRYDPIALAEALGPDLVLRDHEYDEHLTPSGAIQQFLYCVFTRNASPERIP